MSRRRSRHPSCSTPSVPPPGSPDAPAAATPRWWATWTNRTCSRLRLSSTGWLHGCLSSSNRHYIGDLLDKPRHQALPALQRLLMKALDDKQEVAFSGGATVMKIIGG